MEVEGQLGWENALLRETKVVPFALLLGPRVEYKSPGGHVGKHHSRSSQGQRQRHGRDADKAPPVG